MTSNEYIILGLDKNCKYNISRNQFLKSKKLVIIRNGGVDIGNPVRISVTLTPYPEYVQETTSYIKNNKVLATDRFKLTYTKAFKLIKELTTNKTYNLSYNVMVILYPKRK